jgi:5'-3' exoribonuclease 1
MGIPAYFSYIIKNYPRILQKFEKKNIVHNLFLDSNSIIYDMMRTIDYANNDNVYEQTLINAVCKKIETYIQQISPTGTVYIAFDGVAPVAKLNQQKNRRYKSWFMGQYDPSDKPMWDSTAITPGTDFMNKLNLQVRYHFRKPSTFNVNQVIISGSDFPGEGEHKIFDHIREHTKDVKNMKSVIYGLDADLIMLTINNLQYCENMYLFRETPDFIKSIDNSLDPNYMYVIDIPEFKNQLVFYLNNDVSPTTDVERNRVFDYIFLCFMLGNDFLPHFPALNLRTGGMDILMETYRNVLGNSKKNIIVDGKIVWKNFRLLIKELSEHEESYIQSDYAKRNKQEKRPPHFDENACRFDKEMLHAPSKEREVEKYINPNDKFWESRYYDMLFDVDIDDEWRKNISLNYLEGLEWTWKYYSVGCVDWRWSYKHHYPPLLKDLLKYVPYFDTELIEQQPTNPVSDKVQLSYVLPKKSLYLLPKRIENKLLQQFAHLYKTEYEFKWAYCKYFWECHVDFPEINIVELEKIVNE